MSEIREIGFVFQSINLMPRMTLLDNVGLPMVYGGVPLKERRNVRLKPFEKVGFS